MDVRETPTVRIQGDCPGCRSTSLEMRTIVHEIPHFGETLESLIRCVECGFRHVDFLVVHEREPVRYTLRVEGEEDLRARVVRSSSGTLRIPELGFLAEPTGLSESYVSNVEGVLERTQGIFEMARRFHADDPKKVAIATEGLATIARARMGGGGLTLILEDPWGNSAIVHDRAERSSLTPDEVTELKTGVVVIDKSELETVGADADVSSNGHGEL